MNNYQKASINDIYGYDKNISINSDYFYKTHNIIKNGIIFGDKISTVNNLHNIKNSYINHIGEVDEDTKPYEYIDENMEFYPLMSTPETFHLNSYYKLISSKDIDYENAYLKYAVNQISEYKNPIEYTEVLYDDNHNPIINKKNTSDFIFDREITPYINNSYDLLNIVDYLLNRMNCFYFLLENIKTYKK